MLQAMQFEFGFIKLVQDAQYQACRQGRATLEMVASKQIRQVPISSEARGSHATIEADGTASDGTSAADGVSDSDRLEMFVPAGWTTTIVTLEVGVQIPSMD